jgi:solute carrier family 25 protein 44
MFKGEEENKNISSAQPPHRITEEPNNHLSTNNNQTTHKSHPTVPLQSLHRILSEQKVPRKNEPLSATEELQTEHLDSHSLYWDDLNQPKFLGLLAGSALAIRCVFYPLGLIKTRMQTTQNKVHFNSTFSALRTVVRNEGFAAGLYRAFAFNCIGLALEPVFIGTLEYSRMLMKQYYSRNQQKIKMEAKHFDTLTSLCSGGIASVAQQSFLVPIDVVTQRLVVQPEQIALSSNPTQKLRSAQQIIGSIYNMDGFKGFYKGYLLTLSCTVPFSGLVWAMYWRIQNILEQFIHIGKYSDAVIAPSSAAIASTAASWLTQPMDVLKTRLQVQHTRSSTVSAVRQLIAERGWLGLWSGAIPRILIITPTSVLMMSLYEFIKRKSLKPRREI